MVHFEQESAEKINSEMVSSDVDLHHVLLLSASVSPVDRQATPKVKSDTSPSKDQAISKEQVLNLAIQLDSSSFETREQAERALKALGPGVLPFLEQVVGKLKLEGLRRLENIIKPYLHEYANNGFGNWSPAFIDTSPPEDIPKIISLLPDMTKEELEGRKKTLSALCGIMSNPNCYFSEALRKEYLEDFRSQLKELDNLDELKAKIGKIRHIDLRESHNVDAKLARLRGLTGLQHLILRYSDVTDAGLEHLKGFTNLSKLELGETNITDQGLTYVKGLTNLKMLDLQSTKITDAGLEHLKGLTKLDHLLLSYNTSISDAGLKHLKGLTNLRALEFNGANITDAGLEHLQGLTNLVQLWLTNTNSVTDDGLKHLKGLTNLRHLRLANSSITGNGLEHLNGLPKLRYLDLTQTNITDAALVHLKGLPELTNLDLARTCITDAGLEHLKAAKLGALDLAGTNITDAGLAHFKAAQLKSLNLTGTKITDAALEHLKYMGSLHHLGISKTRITERGLAAVIKALPHCNINPRPKDEDEKIEHA